METIAGDGRAPASRGARAGLENAARPGRSEEPPGRWRVLVDGRGSGAENMARDHALARKLGSGTGVLRIYEWSRPTISFGRNEPARGLYDTGAAGREGVSFVRRPTGGRAVLHDRELTYAVAAPARAWDGLRGAYRIINEGLVAGLRDLGVGARLAGSAGDREPSLAAGPCFRTPAEGEIVVAGRKLVGSAQARIGRALLQHGSILLAGSQGRLARIGPEPPDGDEAPATTLSSILGEVPDRASLLDALVEGLAGALGGSWRRAELTGAERAAARELRRRYTSTEWTWRR